MSEMLNCPFCGAEGAVIEAEGRFFAACSSITCLCAVGESYDGYACPDHAFVTEGEAIAAWNTRAPANPAGEGEIERLREIEQAAKVYLNHYLLDEATDPSVCFEPLQHKRALRLYDALNDYAALQRRSEEG